MPKLRKEDVEDININEMEGAEYSDEDYSSYDGEVPTTGTILSGYIKKMWWTRTTSDDPLIKVLWVADDNEDDLEEYNGLPVWENAALIPAAKFRWAPLFATFGFSIRDVVNKTIVASEDDNIGAPIEKIGTFVPGSDESWARVVIHRRKWDNEFQARVKKWLPFREDGEDPFDEADEEEPVDDELDQDLEEEEEEETESGEEPEEEEAEPVPARSTKGRGRTSQAQGRTSGRGQKAEAARTASKPAGRAARTSTPTRTSKPAAAASARRGTPSRAAAKPARGRRTAAADDEPPF